MYMFVLGVTKLFVLHVMFIEVMGNAKEKRVLFDLIWS